MTGLPKSTKGAIGTQVLRLGDAGMAMPDMAALLHMTDGGSRQQMQDFRYLENTFTESQWGQLLPNEKWSFHEAMDVLCLRGLTAGCVSPTEPTKRRWTALLLILEKYENAHCTAEYFETRRSMLKAHWERTKKRMKVFLRDTRIATEPLPADPAAWPEHLRRQLLDRGQPPVPCKIDVALIDKLDIRIGCRGGPCGLPGAGGAGSSQQPQHQIVPFQNSQSLGQAPQQGTEMMAMMKMQTELLGKLVGAIAGTGQLQGHAPRRSPARTEASEGDMLPGFQDLRDTGAGPAKRHVAEERTVAKPREGEEERAVAEGRAVAGGQAAAEAGNGAREFAGGGEEGDGGEMRDSGEEGERAAMASVFAASRKRPASCAPVAKRVLKRPAGAQSVRHEQTRSQFVGIKLLNGNKINKTFTYGAGKSWKTQSAAKTAAEQWAKSR